MRNVKVLLFVVKGSSLASLIFGVLAGIGARDGFVSRFEYVERKTDLTRFAREIFDLILVDLDPLLITEVETFYDAFPPEQQAKVLGWGEGWEREVGEMFPPHRVWLPVGSMVEKMEEQIRQILAS